MDFTNFFGPRVIILEDTGNSISTYRHAFSSMDQILSSGFEQVADDVLIHTSSQDFWSLKKDGDGYMIERLVDDEVKE